MSFSPPSSRTQIYLDQGRYEEAAKLLREQLASSPDDVVTLLQLATCYYQDDTDEGNTKRGLEAIESAIRLEPEFSPAHGLHARLLADQKKYSPALAAAQQAIALDPYDSDSHGAEAVVHAKRQHWALAEKAAKRGLAIDPEDNPCSAILTHALLMQGKTSEHQEELGYRMSRDPEDPYTHFNMGLAALRSGDHRQAEVHLKEALRLQPDFEPARQLLLEAFRSRSPVYRGFLKFSFALSKLPPHYRTGAVIAIYLVFRTLRSALDTAAPIAAAVLTYLWLAFSLFSFIGRGLGNLIILCDPSARLALNARETQEGLCVGLPIALSLLTLIAGIGLSLPLLLILTACLIAPAIPASVYFQAEKRAGQKIYGTAAAITTLCAAIVFIGSFFSSDVALPLHPLTSLPLLLGAGIAFATTWAALFNFKTD